MNIYHVSDNIVRFNIFNLIKDSLGLVGQYSVYYHIQTKQYLLVKKGGFGSLTYFPSEPNPTLFFPTTEQKDFLEPIIQKRLERACYYDRSANLHKGQFLLPELQTREENEEGYLRGIKQYFVWRSDDHASSETKQINKQAVKILDKSHSL